MARVYHARLQVYSQRLAMRLAREVTREIEDGARQILATGPYTTGRLASALQREVHSVPNGARGSVWINGVLYPYAASVERGAKVHWIFPRGAQGRIRFGASSPPMLRFFWRKAGRVVYMPHVPGSPAKIGQSHPGQPGKGYLRRPLIIAGARHHMRVIVYDF